MCVCVCVSVCVCVCVCYMGVHVHLSVCNRKSGDLLFKARHSLLQRNIAYIYK